MCTNGNLFFEILEDYFITLLLSCLLDLSVKVEGVENVLNFITICMNQPFKPEGKIYEQLNNLYKYYENKYGSVSSSTITPSTFGNDSFFIQLAKGKMTNWSFKYV